MSLKQASELREDLPNAGRVSATMRILMAALVTTAAMTGCVSRPKTTVSDLSYCDDKSGVSYYRNHTSRIAWPCIDNQTAEAVSLSREPRNLKRSIDDKPREISLLEAMRLALSNNPVLEFSSVGGRDGVPTIGSNQVLRTPQTMPSVYDPAIQSSGVLFGRRSVESALADFDTTFTTNLIWRRSDVTGVSTAGGGNRADFSSSLRKQFATGGAMSLHHDWVHTVDPAGVNGSTPNYVGRLGFEVRQPLLAGSGVEYTRIAGPANPNFGAITGVSQGVVIARINEDISVADFQINVRDSLRGVYNAYWNLYEAFRRYDSAVVAQKSAFQTWKEANDRLDVGVLKPADELQARDRLYETKAQVETTLSGLYLSETELRRMTGLPMNDGMYLVPSDEPVKAEFVPEWRSSIKEALIHRTELRRQKWRVKSLQLQLQAARSLVRPRFDLVAGYDVNGLGDTLLSQTQRPFGNAFRSMGTADTNSWHAGFLVSVPLGQRFTRSQVRNIELQVTREHAVLASQEKAIAQDIAIAIQNLTANWAASQSNLKRLTAAANRVRLLRTEKEVGTLTLDLVLRAQERLAIAEQSYYGSLANYNTSILELQFAKGTLLQDNGIFLAEGAWKPEAQCDALLRASARTHAKDAPRLQTSPAEFASPGPTGTVELRGPIETDADMPLDELPPVTAPRTDPTRTSSTSLVPLPPDFDSTIPAESPEGDRSGNKPSRTALVEPEPIFDPFHDYDKDPPRTASEKNSDFPSLDIFRK